MSDCLVTQLKGTVGDEYLPRLGEVFVDIETEELTFFHINNYEQETTYRIAGDSYFTDSEGVENYGKVWTQQIGAGERLFMAPGSFRLFFDGKYTITSMYRANTPQGTTKFDLYENRYASFHYITLTNSTIVGPFTNFATWPNLRGLTLYGTSFEEPVTTAQIADVFTGRQSTAIAKLGFDFTAGNITGDISVLKDIPFESVVVSGTSVSGDVSLCKFFYLSGAGRTFSWKQSRPVDYHIMSIVGGVNFGEDLDTMLINQAQCTGVSQTSSLVIHVRGTHDETNAEAVAAIATLQEKGYTVTITAG